MNDSYTPDDIEVHEGLEHVRLRPAMYIGDTYERGLHHLVSEVVDNSVDEAMAGFCTQIEVTIHDDESITILDNGRGIPVAEHPKLKIPTVEACLTRLGVGGKFGKGAYQVSGGLHGVGVSCVNALAEWLEVQVYRDGKCHAMKFARGAKQEDLSVKGKSDKQGTKITFLADSTIFKQSVEFKFGTLAKRLRELAYLNRGLKITLKDERGEGHSEEFEFENGIIDFVNELAGNDGILLTKPVYFQGGVESVDSGGQVQVEVAIQYNDSYSDTLVSYANNIATVEGGTHLTGFRTALTSSMNGFVKENEGKIKGLKGDERPSGDDYREGLLAVISVKIPEPQFEGQTKTKLGNSDVAGIVQRVAGDYLRAWCEQNPGEAKKIVLKAVFARKQRLAAKKAKDMVRKSRDILGGEGISKLTHCESNEPSEREIYLVEGDSAGGTAVKARDTMTQAILPLRGKILNVWKATHDKMLSHNEIATIIQVLGTGILDEFDISKLKYHKIVIMCDADVDGSHIRTLILTFFFRQMPDLIREGRVYVAQPPLFKIAKGKKERFFLTEPDFQRAMLGTGLEGTALVDMRNAEAPVRFSGEKLARLLKLVQDMEKLGRDVEKKHVKFKKYLGRRKDDGRLPYARVKVPAGGKSPAIYSEEDLEAWIAKAKEAKDDLKVWYHTDPLDQRRGADFEITRFTAQGRLMKLLSELEDMGFAWADYFMPETNPDDPFEAEEEGAAPYRLVRDKTEFDAKALSELPTLVRRMAEKGIRVQRYKGLGEMDADELEETTMDPKKRTLLRVTVDDMAEANRIFSTLMGAKVEPRRQFIENHAGEVHNLDV
ncbi:DNA gyrase subunit B [Planctomycetota bacterium]|nr:DNA gyrase subunit B [Planctomycetota bacterium]